MAVLQRVRRDMRKGLNELMIDYTRSIHRSAPDHGNGGYFKGIIDDVRLYRKGFGSEDVYHLYLGIRRSDLRTKDGCQAW